MLFAREALPDAEQEHPRHEHDDRERRDIEEDRDPPTPGRRVEQGAHARISAQADSPVAVREPVRKAHAEAAHERGEVSAPRHGDGDVSNGVFQDQIPTHHPGDQFAQGGVRVGVGAARLRNHGSQFCIAERRQTADHTQQHERENQCRPGRRADDRAVGAHFAGCRSADRREDAGADDRADRQHDEIAGAENSAKRLRTLDRL